MRYPIRPVSRFVLLVANPVRRDMGCFHILQERVTETLLGMKSLQDFSIVIGHACDRDPEAPKSLSPFFQLHELVFAEGSPVSGAIHEQ